MRNAVIIAGGEPPDPAVREDLPESDVWVIGADSGADHASTLGLDLDVIIGDLDSITPSTLAGHPQARVISYPADKDATDLELAIELVAERDDVHRLIIVGGTGGRLDHFLATALILAAPRFETLDIEWLAHPGRVTVVHRHAHLHGTVGSKVSLMPVGGDATGVRTSGLRWPLESEALPFGTSRGVSNEFAAAVAEVSLETGVLLAVQPVD